MTIYLSITASGYGDDGPFGAQIIAGDDPLSQELLRHVAPEADVLVESLARVKRMIEAHGWRWSFTGSRQSEVAQSAND